MSIKHDAVSFDNIDKIMNFKKLLKPLVFLLCLMPLGLLIIALFQDKLGANPIEAVSRETGEWTLRFLLLSLFMTPIQQVWRQVWPARLRRMIGLYAFFYGVVHALVFLGLDQQFDWHFIISEVAEKPYLIVGVISLLIMLPLAVTSNRKMLKALGARWKPLHRWVYIAALSGCLHFVWLGKGDIPEPVIYTLVLLGLMAFRFVRVVR